MCIDVDQDRGNSRPRFRYLKITILMNLFDIVFMMVHGTYVIINEWCCGFEIRLKK